MHLAVVDGELRKGTLPRLKSMYEVWAVWGIGIEAVGYCLWSLDSPEAAGEEALATGVIRFAAADTTIAGNIPDHSSHFQLKAQITHRRYPCGAAVLLAEQHAPRCP